jgi:hypothetical protein
MRDKITFPMVYAAISLVCVLFWCAVWYVGAYVVPRLW